MYVPAAFRPADPEQAYEWIRQYSFATLVSHGADGMIATHLPLLLERAVGAHGALRGHVALPNPQADHLRDANTELLAVFNGPHAYVSPSWYVNADKLVPTWNYVAVHAYGRARIMAEDELVAHLEAIVQTYESGRPQPWSTQRLPAGLVEKLAGGVVGFELTIDRIDAKAKLSQNRAPEDRQSAIAGLRAAGDVESALVAQLMEQADRGH